MKKKQPEQSDTNLRCLPSSFLEGHRMLTPSLCCSCFIAAGAASELLACVYFPSAHTITNGGPTCGLCSPRASWVIWIDHSPCSHLLPGVLLKEWWVAQPRARIDLVSVSYSRSTFYRWVLWWLPGLFSSLFDISSGETVHMEANTTRPPPGFLSLTLINSQLATEHMGACTLLD